MRRKNIGILILSFWLVTLIGPCLHAAEIYFSMGPSMSKKVGDFGGTNYYFGVGAEGALTDDAFWFVQLRGDSLGKDSGGAKKDRISLILGLCHRWDWFSASVGAGYIDSMTTASFDPSKTIVDPFTGVTLYSDESGISHIVYGGYMLQAAARLASFDEFQIETEASYFNTFGTTAYADYFGVGLKFRLAF